MPKTIVLSRDVLSETGIPEKFWPMDLREFPGSKNAVKDCVQFVRKSNEVRKSAIHLYLHGPANSGKTFLGTYILKCLLARGYSVKYTTLPDISRDYVGDGETKHSLRKLYLSSAMFLFIDDVVTEPNKAEKNGLERVLKLRLTAGVPTIMASPAIGSETMLLHGPSFCSFVASSHSVSTRCDEMSFVVEHRSRVQTSKIWGV